MAKMSKEIYHIHALKKNLQSTLVNDENELTKCLNTAMDFIHRKNFFLCLCVQALRVWFVEPPSLSLSNQS